MADHVVIGYVRSALVHGEFSESLLSIAMEGKTPLDAVLRYVSGPNISTPRNLVVDKFLREQRAPWLFMCDTDMVFAADAVDRLIAAADPRDRPLLGVLCFSQNAEGDPFPVLYELAQKDSGELAFHRLTSWPEDACVRVSATGAAGLLMHRSALKRIRVASKDPAAPWFRESAIGAPLALMGEDLTFCLRAAAAGIPVHVYTGVQVGHMKTVMLGKVT